MGLEGESRYYLTGVIGMAGEKLNRNEIAGVRVIHYGRERSNDMQLQWGEACV